MEAEKVAVALVDKQTAVMTLQSTLDNGRKEWQETLSNRRIELQEVAENVSPSANVAFSFLPVRSCLYMGHIHERC